MTSRPQAPPTAVSEPYIHPFKVFSFNLQQNCVHYTNYISRPEGHDSKVKQRKWKFKLLASSGSNQTGHMLEGRLSCVAMETWGIVWLEVTQ